MSCCNVRVRRVACGALSATLFAVSILRSPVHAAEPLRLTHDGRLKMDPVFIRGGEEIVFTVLETESQTSLMRLKLADGSVSRLRPDAATSEFEPAFSADGRYGAFVQSRGNLNLLLVIQDAVSGKDSLFDPGGGFNGMRRPTIAGNSGWVAFAMPGPGGEQIHRVNLQGDGREQLTEGEAMNMTPAYSPDERRIAFSSSREGDFEIHVMDADGKNVRRLTHRRGRDLRPAWSPDGRQIAFVGYEDGNEELFVMRDDGTGLRRVTTHPERDDYPAFHPDGRRLVAVCERQGRLDLYLLDLPPAP